jgi:hypothetical protein
MRTHLIDEFNISFNCINYLPKLLSLSVKINLKKENYRQYHISLRQSKISNFFDTCVSLRDL